MELSEILKITKSCTGFCNGNDCPRYKHSNPTWCLAMNIKALLDQSDAADTNVGNKEIKVGDTVFQTDGVRIYKSTVTKVIYETTGIAFDESAIGNAVFLSEEEALKGATNGTKRKID